MPLVGGLMLCGTIITLAGTANTDLLAEIIDVNGLGGKRIAVSGINGSNVDTGWETMIFSCIASGNPFTVTLCFDPNFNWAASLNAPPSLLTIHWPTPDGWDTEAVLSWAKGGVTSFSMGGGLQARMTATVEITPSGPPTITPGEES